MFLRQYVLVTILVLTFIPITPAKAQSIIRLQLRIPEYLGTLITDDILTEFEEQNHGVQVVLLDNDPFLNAGSPVFDIDEHLNKISEYVNSADVIFFSDSSFLTPEAIQTHAYLDLTPLVGTDPNFNADNYWPAALQSLQWDNGLWGIPTTFDALVLNYDPVAFDNAALAYPNENWTLDDFIAAARQFTQFDSDGNVILPGFFGNTNLLLRILLGQSLYDSSRTPNPPNFNTLRVATLLENFAQAESEGIFGTRGFSGDFMQIPMRLGTPIESLFSETPRQATLLSDGVSITNVISGFLISAGTAYPQQAYALTQFLAGHLRIKGNIGGFSAWREAPYNLPPATPTEAIELIDRALANAIPLSEMRYVEYLSEVISQMNDGVDVVSALQTIEAKALENLQSAAEFGASTVFQVEPDPSSQPLPEGEVGIRFAVVSSLPVLPNQAVWDSIISEFIASDPNVTRVILETDLHTNAPDQFANLVQEYDCFYLPYNAVPSTDLSQLVSLDPFMDNTNHFVGNVLSQVQHNNQTWAYPLDIYPTGIWYNPDNFSQNGFPEPSNDWTINDFTNALTTLNPTPVFSNRRLGGTYLLMLIAGYGGLPVDYRTSPPIINFTSSINIEAIRQVLDLAKINLIEYKALDFLNNQITLGGPTTPLYSDSVNAYGFSGQSFVTPGGGGGGGGGGSSQSDTAPMSLTLYPKSTQYAPVSYEIGSAYISSHTTNPEACYRFIHTIAQHPELSFAMPADLTQLTNPVLATTQRPELLSFYNDLAVRLNDPTVIEFPEQFGSASSFSSQMDIYWLTRAFDRYVLEGADLELELAEAEIFTMAYQECIGIAPLSTPPEPFEPYLSCATRVDPSLAAFSN